MDDVQRSHADLVLDEDEDVVLMGDEFLGASNPELGGDANPFQNMLDRQA